MAEEERPEDAAEEAAERASGTRWEVAALVALLALHLATAGWNQPWLAAGFVLMLLLRIRDAMRAGRADPARRDRWPPRAPWRR